MAKGIRTTWIDSTTPEVIGVKVYRDDVEIADVGLGELVYKDPTPLPNVEYKYEVQAYTADAESENEVLGVNIAYYEIVEAELEIPTGIQLELIAVDLDIDLYVSANGSGTEDGLTEENSMSYADAKTAIPSLQPGETMGFKRDDTFEGQLTISDLDGSNGNPITFGAYGSGVKPIFTTIEEVSLTWSATGDANKWVATSGLPSEISRLLIDDVEIFRGAKSQSTNTYTYDALGTNVPSLIEWYFGEKDNDDTDALYLWSTTDPNGRKVEFSQENYTIYTYRNSYLTFKDIDIQGGYYYGMNVGASDNIIIDGITTGKYCAGGLVIGAYSSVGSTNITVNGCSIDASFSSFNWSTAGEEGSDLIGGRGPSDGLRVTSVNGLVINGNTVKNWTHSNVSIQDSVNVITDIDIYDNLITSPDVTYGGRVGWNGVNCDNIRFYRNTIKDTSVGNAFNAHDCHIHHNIIDGVKAPPTIWYPDGNGIVLEYLSGAVTGNIIEYNLVMNCDNSGMVITDNSQSAITNNIIRNNIFLNNDTQDRTGFSHPTTSFNYQMFINDDGYENNQGNTFNNNIYHGADSNVISYYGTKYAPIGIDIDTFNADTAHNQTISNNQDADPLFVSGTDYHLTEESPAVNSGITGTATSDFEGNTIPYPTTLPDIGIYESEYVNAHTGLYPVLSGFTINDAEPTRINFVASLSVTGLTVTGFYLGDGLGKTIDSVTLQPDGLSGYFTVSSAFNHWDNYAIRLGGTVDNIQANPLLYNFSLSYIENNIVKPVMEVADYKYVTVGASGSGDGSEGNPWTLQQAITGAQPGATVWCQAGDYGNIQSTVTASGTAAQPIEFRGYKTVVGDITSNYFSYGTTWDNTEMPTLTGSSPEYGNIALYLQADYIKFKYFQLTNYSFGFRSSGQLNNITLDTCNMMTFGSQTEGNGDAISLRDDTHHHLRALNLVLLNSSMEAIKWEGSYNLIDNVKSYNDRIGSTERSDYHISFGGGVGTIVRNCYAENTTSGADIKSVHGIGIRGWNYGISKYNLIEKCVSINSQENFYIRNIGSDHNVIKDCQGYGHDDTDYSHIGGVSFWGGVNYNLVERVKIWNGEYGIEFKDNDEDDSPDTSTGSFNKIRNVSIENVAFVMRIYQQTGGEVGQTYDNTFEQCTINNCRWFYWVNNTDDVERLIFKNCNITNMQYGSGEYTYNGAGITGESYEYCNTWNNLFTIPNQSNGISIDPQYVNTVDFLPQNELLVAPKIVGVNYDINKDEREDGIDTTIGLILKNN